MIKVMVNPKNCLAKFPHGQEQNIYRSIICCINRFTMFLKRPMVMVINSWGMWDWIISAYDAPNCMQHKHIFASSFNTCTVCFKAMVWRCNDQVCSHAPTVWWRCADDTYIPFAIPSTQSTPQHQTSDNQSTLPIRMPPSEATNDKAILKENCNKKDASNVFWLNLFLSIKLSKFAYKLNTMTSCGVIKSE